jgi:hypothetical protein
VEGEARGHAQTRSKDRHEGKNYDLDAKTDERPKKQMQKQTKDDIFTALLSAHH